MAKVILKKKPTCPTSPQLTCLNCGMPLTGRRKKFCCVVCKDNYYIRDYSTDVNYQPSWKTNKLAYLD